MKITQKKTVEGMELYTLFISFRKRYDRQGELHLDILVYHYDPLNLS